MMSRSRHRRQGASVWGVFTVLALLFLGLAIGVLSGTGVFRNWGKKALDNEAELALHLAMGPLLHGDIHDRSDTFPKHAAGQAAKEVYTFLRLDVVDKPEIDRSFAAIRALAEKPGLAPAGFKQASKLTARLTAIYDERQNRAARMVLRLKATAMESDRLGRQYRKISQAFREAGTEPEGTAIGTTPREPSGLRANVYGADNPEDKRRPPDETDNLFGGPNLLLELEIEYAQTVVGMYDLRVKNPTAYQVVAGRVVASNPSGDLAREYREKEAKLARVLNMIAFNEMRIGTAVDAERRGVQRRLGISE